VNLPVTYLFVPGNRPERFDKALAAGADAVILDLEDAVSPRDKDKARANVRQWAELHQEAAEHIVVRINDGATPWFASDLDLLSQAGVRLAMLPKAETAKQVDAVRAALPPKGHVLPIVETALGVDNLEVVASAKGVRFHLGSDALNDQWDRFMKVRAAFKLPTSDGRKHEGQDVDLRYENRVIVREGG